MEKINYITQIKGFWRYNNEIPIGCNATALYFYLLDVCSSLKWKETFKHSDKRISAVLGISVNTVKDAKTRLKKLGLIDFQKPENTSRGLDGTTSYKIITLSKSDSVSGCVPDSVSDETEAETLSKSDSVPDSVSGCVPDSVSDETKTPSNFDSVSSCVPDSVSDTETETSTKNPEKTGTLSNFDSVGGCLLSNNTTILNNNNNNNNNNNIPPLPPQKNPKPVFDFVESDFEKPFFMWLDYKKKRRESYKAQNSLELAYEKLKKLSDNDCEVAAAIVRQSMENNWAGLFELNKSSKTESKEFKISDIWK